MAQTPRTPQLRLVEKKFILWVGSAVAMTMASLFCQPSRLNSSIRNTEPIRPPVSRNKQNVNNSKIRAFGQEPTPAERSYNSILRYDWTNLPPMTPLGKILELSSSKCMRQHGPHELVYFEMIPSGMGSSLHTWMNPLCHAALNGKVLITGGTDKFKQPWEI